MLITITIIFKNMCILVETWKLEKSKITNNAGKVILGHVKKFRPILIMRKSCVKSIFRKNVFLMLL